MDSFIFFLILLNTDLVPTKNLPDSGLVPHTIDGLPSILRDILLFSFILYKHDKYLNESSYKFISALKLFVNSCKSSI